jgi:hypothetical protein
VITPRSPKRLSKLTFSGGVTRAFLIAFSAVQISSVARVDYNLLNISEDGFPDLVMDDGDTRDNLTLTYRENTYQPLRF